jgi:RNA 3'-terminal phosphate cyclase
MKQTLFEKQKALLTPSLILAIHVMGWSQGKYFKNGGGCYPFDAKPVNDKPGKEWSATSIGGTYPFLSGDTIFRTKESFGVTWDPFIDSRQAAEVAEMLSQKNVIFDITNRWDDDSKGWQCSLTVRRKPSFVVFRARGSTVAEAICNAALKLVSR